jgi:hypothetical protein
MLSLLSALALTTTAAHGVISGVAPHTAVLTVHAEGAQIYECRADTTNALRWAFREPVASLTVGAKTVGHHYGGPSWALEDGGLIMGQIIATLPGASVNDIPQLKLKVIAHQGGGVLAPIRFVYRVRTQGGAVKGDCKTAGALRPVAYSADYIFST